MNYDDIIKGRVNSEVWDVPFFCWAGFGGTTTTWINMSISTGGDLFAPDIGIVTGTLIPTGQIWNGAYGGIPIGAPAASSGRQRYLLSAGFWNLFAAGGVSHVYLVDTLWCGIFPVNVTGAQTITMAQGITRYTDGVGVQLAVVAFSSPMGGNASNLTVTYTNSDGVANRTTPAQAMTPSVNLASMMVPWGSQPYMKLQAGDVGVRSVQSLSLNNSMGTATYAALMIMRPLVLLTCAGWQDFAEFDLCQLPEGPILLPTDWLDLGGGASSPGCIMALGLTNSASATNFHGMIRTISI